MLLPSISSADLLLCFGDDGHIAIEKSFLGSCDGQDVHDSEHDENTIRESHCGPCTDIPFLQNSIRETSLEKLSSETKLRYSNTFFISQTNRPRIKLKTLLNHSAIDPPPPTSVALLKTVVLLI